MDTIFPFLVGHRTQIILLVVAVLKFVSDMGWIDPHTINQIVSVALPAAGATFAAKIDRVAEVTQQNAAPVVIQNITPTPAPPTTTAS